VEVFYRLRHLEGQLYFAVTGDYARKRLYSYKESIRPGEFLTQGFVKDTSQIRHSVAAHKGEFYVFEDLNENVQYLKLGSFKSYYPILGEADSFAQAIEGKLTAPHLIVDVRDNTGGGLRNGKQFFKELKKYAKKGKIYILINHRSTSMTEQFILRARDWSNCTLLGDYSGGMVASGRGNPSYDLPSGYFFIHLAMDDFSKWLPYENVGVQPDVFLNYDEDWIEQTLTIIKDL